MATDSEKPTSELTADEAYLQFIATGDESFFGHLYELLHGNATGYAKKLVKDSDNLRDVDALVFDSVHDAFNTILKQQRGLRKGIWSPECGNARLTTWFMGIVGNEVRNRLRLRYGDHKDTRQGDKKEESVDREGNSLVEAHADENAETPVEMLIEAERVQLKAEEAKATRDCVDQLDETPKQVVQMKIWEGKGLREIAEQFGWITEKQRPMTERVDRMIKAAIKMLTECMQAKGFQ